MLLLQISGESLPISRVIAKRMQQSGLAPAATMREI
jgi:hypothetical protein